MVGRVGLRDGAGQRLGEIRAGAQHDVELAVGDPDLAGGRHVVRGRDQHVRERPQPVAQRVVDGHAATLTRSRAWMRWSAVRAANAAIVLVGFTPPEVGNTLPSTT